MGTFLERFWENHFSTFLGVGWGTTRPELRVPSEFWLFCHLLNLNKKMRSFFLRPPSWNKKMQGSSWMGTIFLISGVGVYSAPPYTPVPQPLPYNATSLTGSWLVLSPPPLHPVSGLRKWSEPDNSVAFSYLIPVLRPPPCLFLNTQKKKKCVIPISWETKPLKNKSQTA